MSYVLSSHHEDHRLTLDGNGSGSAIPSAEPLSPAVTPSGNEVDGSDW